MSRPKQLFLIVLHLAGSLSRKEFVQSDGNAWNDNVQRRCVLHATCRSGTSTV